MKGDPVQTPEAPHIEDFVFQSQIVTNCFLLERWEENQQMVKSLIPQWESL